MHLHQLAIGRHNGLSDVAMPLRVVLTTFLFLAAFSVAAQHRMINDEFGTFSKAEQESRGKSTLERAREVGSAYDRIFGSINTRDLTVFSDDDLEALFRATNVVIFYSMRVEDLDRLKNIYRELDSRGLSNENLQSDVYEAHISMRAFSDAANFRAQWGRDNLEPVPIVLQQMDETKAGPTALEIENDQVLRQHSLSLERGPIIIVISHPLCHFSRNAVHAIEAHTEASDVILSNAVWLAPVDRRLYIDVLRIWNQEHPEAKVQIAYKRDEWPMIDSWSTPTFYFLEDGTLKAKVVGWPEQGMMSQLLDAARLIGLKPRERYRERD